MEIITINDIHNTNVGNGTKFYKTFKKATEYIRPCSIYNNKRLLFLTDGECAVDRLSSLYNQFHVMVSQFIFLDLAISKLSIN